MSFSTSFFPAENYAGLPPVLVAASSDTAQRRAAEAIEGAGFRVAAVAMPDAFDRLGLQVSASALWIEADEEDGPSLDRLLARVDAEAGIGRFPSIISAPFNLIDLISAQLHDSRIELLIEPTVTDRVSALAVATCMRGEGARLHDIASEHNAERLRQLSDEVGRIASTLARLSAGPAAATEKPVVSAADGHAPSVSGDLVRQVIRARRLRARYFDEQLFADPAWDMLLDLLAAEIAQHRVPVSSLCIAAAVPPTTALRWIKTMTDNGLFLRRADPHDGRRIFVELSPDASLAMRHYFDDVGQPLAA
jgi:hypothetical protein